MIRSLSLLLVCALAGCGGSSGQTVQGKVTFADGSPLAKGVVVYVGKTGTYRGAIQADGSYQLKDVAKGDYQVAITGATEGGASGEPQYDDKGNYIEPPATKITWLIKETYADADRSGLAKTVPGDYAIQVDKP